MHGKELFRSVAWLSFSLLSVTVRCAEYPEPNQICLASCSLSLSKQTFSGEESHCENELAVQSLYLCGREYCEDSEIEPGREFVSEKCEEEGDPALPPTSLADGLSLQDVHFINSTYKGKNLNYTVIPDHDFFELSYISTRTRAQGRYTNRDYENAIYIFWGLVTGLATVVNVASLALAAGWPPKFMAKAVHQVESHASVPLLLPRQAHPGATRLEAAIIAAFVVLSVVLSCVRIEAFYGSPIYATFAIQVWGLIARRLGDMALANLPLIWLFSMRNNPLIWATGWSYATFSQFHRWVARVTVVELAGHAIAFTKFEWLKGEGPRYVSMFEEMWWRMGFLGFLTMFVMAMLSVPVIRYRFYDSFLLLHILLAIVAFCGIWFHLHLFGTYFTAYLWPVVAFWAFERFMRLLRVLSVAFFGSGAKGTAALSWDEAANVVRVDATELVRKLRPQPGNTYYLYTPTRFPFYQSHPFTLAVFPSDASGLLHHTETADSDHEKGEIVKMSMAEKNKSPGLGLDLQYRFLIRPANGFTRRLQRFAARNNSGEKETATRLPLLVEGPYDSGNQTPERCGCTSVLIMAGGSGISVAISAIHRALASPEARVTHVRLCWAVKRRATIESLARDELRAFLLDPRFTMDCYVTDSSAQTEASTTAAGSQYRISTARPNVADTIRTAVANSADRLGVVVCGPKGMTADARTAVSVILKDGNENVRLFVESFGW